VELRAQEPMPARVPSGVALTDEWARLRRAAGAARFKLNVEKRKPIAETRIKQQVAEHLVVCALSSIGRLSSWWNAPSAVFGVQAIGSITQRD
jgi:hypothetical protein